jgi:ubiquinone/menaquinone biosynthesis C-methylase UbiE
MSEEERSWARTYAETPYTQLPWYSPHPSSWVKRAVENRWIRPPSRILDIGCGAGTNVLWLAREGFQATGLDLAPGAIEAARGRAKRRKIAATFVQGSATAMPFPKSAFGAASDNGCFHAIPVAARDDYASEVARVVRPGGAYLLSWIGREETRTFGPPHRPSVQEVASIFEPRFIFLRTEFFGGDRPGAWTTRGSGGQALARYSALLQRRRSIQPPAR